jgi:hypothetical protein
MICPYQSNHVHLSYDPVINIQSPALKNSTKRQFIELTVEYLIVVVLDHQVLVRVYHVLSIIVLV